MVFSSILFLYLFVPIFFLLYYIAPFRYKNVACLLFSLFFYAWGEPYYIVLMLFSISINYLLGLGLHFKNAQSKRKKFMIAACIFNISILVIFKYLSFFSQSVFDMMGIQKQFPAIMLPLGISFYTFQTLSYIFDVYRREVPVQTKWSNLALYVSMFPQLVAGPIVRYGDINREINSRKPLIEDINYGIFRFIIGLSKKVLISNSLGVLADSVWNTSNLEISVITAWMGLVAYTLQIYFDFSGYSDMAIGLGRMIGFHFNENFNYPYMATSISEFWRRWHISLGSWFRDYVYFPMGGSRTSKRKMIFNLFFVWMLTGLWHGANWTFVLWGIYYGVIICIEKLFDMNRLHIPRPFMHILCMLFVMVGWVFFRSDSIAEASHFLARLIGVGGNGFIGDSAYLYIHDYLLLILVASIGSMPYIKTYALVAFIKEASIH